MIAMENDFWSQRLMFNGSVFSSINVAIRSIKCPIKMTILCLNKCQNFQRIWKFKVKFSTMVIFIMPHKQIVLHPKFGHPRLNADNLDIFVYSVQKASLRSLYLCIFNFLTKRYYTQRTHSVQIPNNSIQN